MPAKGSPVYGTTFFNREVEIKQIQRDLKDDHILIVAPRRFGKTSLMKQTQLILTEEEKASIFLDVMHIETPQDFLIEIIDRAIVETKSSMREKLSSAISTIFSSVEELSGSVITGDLRVKFREQIKDNIDENNWREKGDHFFNMIHQLYDQYYFIIDELTEAVFEMFQTEPKSGVRFLKWFRSMRNKYGDKIKFIVGGSISFDRVVKEMVATSSINDFARVPVGPFSTKDSIMFIEYIFKKEDRDISRDDAECILETLGDPTIPYFISIFCDALILNEGEITPELIINSYGEDLLGAYGNSYFDYYRERLRYYNPEIRKSIVIILKELSKSNLKKSYIYELFKEHSNIQSEEAVDAVLKDLENDYYISVEDGEVFFKLKLLADWWRL